MAGKTAMMVGRWHNRLVHVPMYIATRERKQVTLDSNLWQSVLETTGMLKWVKE
jgi:6-phosphofructokinase 1